MITLDFSAETYSGQSQPIAPGIVLVPLHDGLWRVTRTEGEVLGYVESFTARDGERFRAKRLSARLRTFLTIGEFWRMDEALDCFRMG